MLMKIPQIADSKAGGGGGGAETQGGIREQQKQASYPLESAEWSALLEEPASTSQGCS